MFKRHIITEKTLLEIDFNFNKDQYIDKPNEHKKMEILSNYSYKYPTISKSNIKKLPILFEDYKLELPEIDLYLNENKTQPLTTTGPNHIDTPQREYTITYNANGGTVSVPSQTSTYVFAGYYDGVNQMIDGNGLITNDFTSTTYLDDKTLNAHWIEGSIIAPTATKDGFIQLYYAYSSGVASCSNYLYINGELIWMQQIDGAWNNMLTALFPVSTGDVIAYSSNDGTTAKTILPKTGDNIVIYIVITVISVFGILAIVIYKKKKSSKK